MKYKHENGATSIVKIKGNIVVKKVVNYSNYKIFEREIFWLTTLNKIGVSWCPKLLYYNNNTKTLHLEYAGERINKYNFPIDWKEQLKNILFELHCHNLKHNDIKYTDLLVKNSRLYLIDYGWMSVGNDWSCGGKFPNLVKPVHNYKDEFALDRIEKTLGERKVYISQVYNFLDDFIRDINTEEIYTKKDILDIIDQLCPF